MDCVRAEHWEWSGQFSGSERGLQEVVLCRTRSALERAKISLWMKRQRGLFEEPLHKMKSEIQEVAGVKNVSLSVEETWVQSKFYSKYYSFSVYALCSETVVTHNTYRTICVRIPTVCVCVTSTETPLGVSMWACVLDWDSKAHTLLQGSQIQNNLEGALLPLPCHWRIKLTTRGGYYFVSTSYYESHVGGE